MINIVRFALSFNNPHGNRWIHQMTFVKVKDCFLSDNIQYLFHYISLFICKTNNAIPKNPIANTPKIKPPSNECEAVLMPAHKKSNPAKP